jgi:DNA topoisomerase-1
MGGLVSEVLVATFPDIFDIEFTARIEDELDKIERGKLDKNDLLSKFYKSFSEDLDGALDTIKDKKDELEEETDIKCEMCGAPMVVKYGRRGKFLGCSNYPECEYTANYEKVDGRIEKVDEEETDEVCEKCGAPMTVKVGRYGKFLGCTKYPECKSTKPIIVETGVDCPREDCDGKIIERRTRKGRIFYGCSNYPECDFALWNKPYLKKCPKCDNPYLVIKGKRPNTKLSCPMEECDYEEPFEG